MSFTQFTTTIDSKGYANMDEVMQFLASLPLNQRVIIHSHLTTEMLNWKGNEDEARRHEDAIKVMQANWLYRLGWLYVKAITIAFYFDYTWSLDHAIGWDDYTIYNIHQSPDHAISWDDWD